MYSNNSRQSDVPLLTNSGYGKKEITVSNIFKTNIKHPFIIAGPCAIENSRYLEMTAEYLVKKQVRFLRAGAYKPRTSPYEFQGLKLEGLKISRKVAEKYKMYTVAEVVDTRDVSTLVKYVDVLQVGSRNMHNFELLKEIGKTGHPVVLKRGLSATINEFINAAEYIIYSGNEKVIMCERGIRTYETKTRNTLDLSCVAILKMETRLPVLVDLSHSLGRKDIVNQMSAAALAAGADGIMIEVHPEPQLALSDSRQQLDFTEFDYLIKCLTDKNYL